MGKQPIRRKGDGSGGQHAREKDDERTDQEHRTPPSRPSTQPRKQNTKRPLEKAMVIREGGAAHTPVKRQKTLPEGKGKGKMTEQEDDSTIEDTDTALVLLPEQPPTSNAPVDKAAWEGTFISEEAYRDYGALCTKQFMPENPMNFHACEKAYPEMLGIIKKRQWQRFMQGPKLMANITAVRELYANWNPKRGDIVWVRGQNVDISANAINEYYRLRSPVMTEYNKICSQPDYNDILQVLCDPPINNDEADDDSRIGWKGNTKTKYATLAKKFMIKEARAWHNWVCNRLMPAEHQTHVTWARVMVVYALMKNVELNLGEIMHEQMVRTRSNMQWKVYFVHTLTAILRRHKVPFHDSDEMADVPDDHDFTAVQDPTAFKEDRRSYGERLEGVEAKVGRLRQALEERDRLLAIQLEARDTLLMGQLAELFAEIRATRATRSIGTQTEMVAQPEVVDLSATEGTTAGVPTSVTPPGDINTSGEGHLIHVVDAAGVALIDPASPETVVLGRSPTHADSAA